MSGGLVVPNLTLAAMLYPELLRTTLTNVQYFQHGVPLSLAQRLALPMQASEAWTEETLVSALGVQHGDFVFFQDATDLDGFVRLLHGLLYGPLALQALVTLLVSLVGQCLPCWGRSPPCCSCGRWARRLRGLHESDDWDDSDEEEEEAEAEAANDADAHVDTCPCKACECAAGEKAERRPSGTTSCCVSPGPVLAMTVLGLLLALGALVLFLPAVDLFPGLAARDRRLAIVLSSTALAHLLVLALCAALSCCHERSRRRRREPDTWRVRLAWAVAAWVLPGLRTPKGWHSGTSLDLRLQAAISLAGGGAGGHAVPPPALDYDAAGVERGQAVERALVLVCGLVLSVCGLGAAAWVAWYPYAVSPFAHSLPNLMFAGHLLAAVAVALHGSLLLSRGLAPDGPEAAWAVQTMLLTSADGELAVVRDRRVPVDTALQASWDAALTLVALVAAGEALQLPDTRHRTARSVAALLLATAPGLRRWLWALVSPCMVGDLRWGHLARQARRAFAKEGKENPEAATHRLHAERRLAAPRLYLQLNAEDRCLRGLVAALHASAVLAGATVLVQTPALWPLGWLHLRSGRAWYYWPVVLTAALLLGLAFVAGLHFLAAVYRLATARARRPRRQKLLPPSTSAEGTDTGGHRPSIASTTVVGDSRTSSSVYLDDNDSLCLGNSRASSSSGSFVGASLRSSLSVSSSRDGSVSSSRDSSASISRDSSVSNSEGIFGIASGNPSGLVYV